MARAVILTADGFDDAQAEYAYHRLREDAVLTSIVTPDGGTVTGRRGCEWTETLSVGDLSGWDDYDIVIVPGGRAPERLRLSESALEWLRTYVADGGIVGVIGHGVQVLASIDALDGRTVTGPPELAVDVENAGASYTGEEVAVDGTLVTARGDDALPFFLSATLSNALIPQDPARIARERPAWTSTGIGLRE